MDIQINEPVRARWQATPWTLTAAAGAGIMSFLVCRALFKQTKAAAFLQSYIVLTSTLGALKAASECAPCAESDCKETPHSESQPRTEPEAGEPRSGHGKRAAKGTK